LCRFSRVSQAQPRLLAADAAKDVVEQAALADENVQRLTKGKNVVKVIVVPGRLVNVVVQ